jgi:PAS domain S-box-containing protein
LLGSIATVLLFLLLSVPIIIIYNKSLRNYIAALGESEEKWRSLTEDSPDHIMLLDLNYNILFINHMVPDLKIENVIGKSYLDFVPPDQQQIAIDCFMRVIHSGKADQYDANYITTGEETRHFNVRVAPVMDKDGSITGFVSSSTNVTESKQVEKALKESEEKYRGVVENANEGIIVTQDGMLKFINRKTVEFSGYTEEELISRPFIEIVHPDDQQVVMEHYLKRLKGEEIPGVYVLRIIAKDGTVKWLESNGVIITWDGKPATLILLSDITDRKKMEEELLRAQKLESVGLLAGGIAHDFNNILTSVIGYTELSLDEVQKGTHIEDNLQEIYTAGKRARDLVRQILAFARQSEEELKPIQIDTIATEVLKFIRSSIPTTIEIKQTIESDSLIMGNATQMHQILMNLFTNASHAMEDTGGILEFSLKDVVLDRGVNRGKLDLRPGNYIEIKVLDTGTGIAPENIGSIFDPYFTTKGPGEGTGMGLAMVHGIVESYGGKISVHSKPGQGALFTIYLPVTGKRQEHHPYQSEKLPTGTERILFVDDEASIAKMGGQALERLGYTVSIRTSSIEALELFRKKPNDFDLVITDMTMPNMTGDRLAIELMKIRHDIPVILCTGYSKRISDEMASEIGVKAFIYKPIVKADLAKTIRKVLDETKDSTYV